MITPNIPETEALTGFKISDTASIQQAALDLQKQGAKNVIIKGGHSLNSQVSNAKIGSFYKMVNILF